MAVVSLGILFLAIAITLLSSWKTNRGYEDATKKQGLKIVGDLAEKCVLPLLYESKEDALVALEKVLGFNNIVEANLYFKDGTRFQTVGDSPHGPLEKQKPCIQKGPSLFSKDEMHWHFCAPVTVGGPSVVVASPFDDMMYEKPDEEKELLGFVQIAIDMTPLHEFQYEIMMNNMVIAISVALALLVFVNWVINRLVRPLYSLSEKIRGAQKAVQLEGPKEIVAIASVYNDLIDELSNQRKMLEAEVVMRTKELVQARDLALAASHSKSRFVANTSHELRTPLQSIMGYSELTREQLLEEGRDDIVELLDIICSDADRLLTLINSILDLSKAESGEIELKLASEEIHHILKEAAQSVRPLMDFHKNSLSIQDRTNNCGPVLLDRMKILQILTNLLSNAAKFTKEGQVTLTATIEEHRLLFYVADTGVGISPEDQKEIFEAFKQVEGVGSPELRGTGLGLAITKQFCSLMGGEITVESELGKGSVFRVELPFKKPIEG